MNRFSIYSYKRDCFYPTKTKFVDTGQWRFTYSIKEKKKKREKKKRNGEREFQV